MTRKPKNEARIIKAIYAKQAEAGNAEPWEYGNPFVMQGLIESGQAWLMEGSCGRAANDYLTEGVCFLPREAHRDYWGNQVPGRDMLKPGTKGTLQNAMRYWKVK
jgi:hypothetical protein